MFFRNLTLFRFPAGAGDLFLKLLWTGLEGCRAKPVGPSEMMSRGFVPPFGSDATELHVRAGMAYWITLGGENRLLPAGVINAELHKRITAAEEREGRKLGGRARKRLREDLVMELLPRALVQPYRLNAMLDLRHGYIAVDSTGRRAAENLVSELRHALGSFPALPLNAEVSARAVLTGWIAGEPLPAGLVIGDSCTLKDPIDGGAVVRCQHQELQGEEIRKHLESGKQCSRLALTLDDHISFELGEDLVVRKLRFLDGVVDQLEGQERDGLQAELDARFALMSGEVGRLFTVLDTALKFSAAEG